MIERAVIDIGFPNATTTLVAERLGVDQSTVYGHVRSKLDMMLGAAELAASEAPWPESFPEFGNDWRALLTTCAENLWDTLTRYPGLAQLMKSTSTVPQTMQKRIADLVIHLVMSFKWDVELAALAVDSIGDLVTDAYLMRASIEAVANETQAHATSTHIFESQAQQYPGSHPEIVAVYSRIVGDAIDTGNDHGSWWQSKVDLILDGIQYRLDLPVMKTPDRG